MNKELIEEIKNLYNIDTKAEILISNRPDLCDYQYNGTFELAKTLHQNPFDIGEKIVEKLLKNTEALKKFSKIECVRPGFINFTLTDSYINECLNKMKKENKYNVTLPKQETIVIDYGGANVAKPLHVGHLRPAIVGESIKTFKLYESKCHSRCPFRRLWLANWPSNLWTKAKKHCSK